MVNLMNDPTLSSAAWNAETGQLVVSGSDLLAADGGDNDIDLSKLALSAAEDSITLEGFVDIDSATQFTWTASEAMRQSINAVFDRDGTESSAAANYKLTATDDWVVAAEATLDIGDATENVTVSKRFNQDAQLVVSSESLDAPSVLETSTHNSTDSDQVVAEFLLADGGGGDKASVLISSLRFTIQSARSLAYLNSIVWRLNGPDAAATTGSFNSDTGVLNFSGLSISVADNAAETYTLTAYLYNTSGLSDHYSFTVALKEIADLGIAAGSSTFEPLETPLTLGRGEIAVTATELRGSPPTNARSGANMDAFMVIATDAFGNIDKDYEGTVGLTLNEEANSILDGASAIMTEGEAQFDKLRYVAAQDGEIVTLFAGINDLDSELGSTELYVVPTKLRFEWSAFEIETLDWNQGEMGLPEIKVTAVDDDGLVATSFTEKIKLQIEPQPGSTGSGSVYEWGKDPEEILQTSATSGQAVFGVGNQIFYNSAGTGQEFIVLRATASSGGETLTGASSTIRVRGKPTLDSARYDAASGQLTVSVTDVKGIPNGTVDPEDPTRNHDIDLSRLSLIGVDCKPVDLAGLAEVNDAGDTFTVVFDSGLKAAVNKALDKDGAQSSDECTYNLRARDNWDRGIDESLDISDSLTPLIVSGWAVPSIPDIDPPALKRKRSLPDTDGEVGESRTFSASAEGFTNLEDPQWTLDGNIVGHDAAVKIAIPDGVSRLELRDGGRLVLQLDLDVAQPDDLKTLYSMAEMDENTRQSAMSLLDGNFSDEELAIAISVDGGKTTTDRSVFYTDEPLLISGALWSEPEQSVDIVVGYKRLWEGSLIAFNEQGDLVPASDAGEEAKLRTAGNDWEPLVAGSLPVARSLDDTNALEAFEVMDQPLLPGRYSIFVGILDGDDVRYVQRDFEYLPKHRRILREQLESDLSEYNTMSRVARPFEALSADESRADIVMRCWYDPYNNLFTDGSPQPDCWSNASQFSVIIRPDASLIGQPAEISLMLETIRNNGEIAHYLVQQNGDWWPVLAPFEYARLSGHLATSIENQAALSALNLQDVPFPGNASVRIPSLLPTVSFETFTVLSPVNLPLREVDWSKVYLRAWVLLYVAGSDEYYFFSPEDNFRMF